MKEGPSLLLRSCCVCLLRANTNTDRLFSVLKLCVKLSGGLVRLLHFPGNVNYISQQNPRLKPTVCESVAPSTSSKIFFFSSWLSVTEVEHENTKENQRASTIVDDCSTLPTPRHWGSGMGQEGGYKLLHAQCKKIYNDCPDAGRRGAPAVDQSIISLCGL